MSANLDYERRLQAVERFMREIRGDRGAVEPASWSPSWTGLTVVGSATYTAQYHQIGKLVFWRVYIVAGGANTTASTLNTTYIDNPPVNVAQDNPSLGVVNITSGALYGQGYCLSGSPGQLRTPTWAATNGTIYISGWYERA